MVYGSLWMNPRLSNTSAYLGGKTKIVRSSSFTPRHRDNPFMSKTFHNSRSEKSGVLNRIHQHVREILLSYPNGIEPDSFSQTYRFRFGRWLQYPELGYSSVHDFIRSIPGVIVMHKKKRELIFYCPERASRETEASLQNFSPDSPCPTQPPRIETSEDHVITPENDTSVTLPTVDSDIFSEFPLPEPVNSTVEFTDVAPVQTERVYPPTPSPPPLDSHRSSPESTLERHQEMHEKVSQEVSYILSDHEKTRLEVLETKYQERYGVPLPCSDFGFSSPLELIESLWDTCHLERKCNAIFLIYIDRSKVQIADPLTSESRYSHSRVDPDIGKRVRILLQDWPSGMPHHLITDKYRNRYRDHLPVLELGFRDSLDMMLDIPDFVRVTPWNTDPRKTYYILSDVPLMDEAVNEVGSMDGDIDPIELSPYDELDIPFEKQPIPASWEFNVYLPFISNPDKFWIQIVGLKTSSVTEVMLEEMTKFYTNLKPSSVPRYRIAHPQEGQSCAAPYQRDNCYYRAKVLKIPYPDQAEVSYVDYGNKSRVPIGSLRRIELGRMILPAQAIRCRLANVRPTNGTQWPSGSADLLKDLANDSELFCRVQNIEPDDTLSVDLYNPRSDSGESLNKLLIARGIAVRVDENFTPLHPSCPRVSHENKPTAIVTPHYLAQIPPVHIPYNQHPGIMAPYSLPNAPFYTLPSHPYMHPLPSYCSPHMQPQHYMPSYSHPIAVSVPHDRRYLSASIPTPEVPIQPQLQPHLPSRDVTQPPWKCDHELVGDSYMFNEMDNQTLERTVGEKQDFLGTSNHIEFCEEMGAFEKVHKFLLTHTTSDELEMQMQAERERLLKLKKSREELVAKKFDVKKDEISRFVSELNKISSEIDQLETKLLEMVSLSVPNSPSPDVATIPTISPPLLNQSFSPPPSTPTIGAYHSLSSEGQKTMFKYKGIGRGGKMSDLV